MYLISDNGLSPNGKKGETPPSGFQLHPLEVILIQVIAKSCYATNIIGVSPSRNSFYLQFYSTDNLESIYFAYSEFYPNYWVLLAVTVGEFYNWINQLIC